MTMIKRLNNGSLAEAFNILKAGGIIAFPTDTVYGIGAMPFNKAAVQKLYRIKKREKKKPVALLISSKKMAGKFAMTIPSKAKKLITKHWPGPLTLIFKKRRSVPDFLTSRLSTIGIRMPKNDTALKLIKKAGGALAVTSANVSGNEPAVLAGQIKGLKGIDLIIDGGKCKIGIPSSVVLVGKDKLAIIRKGPVKQIEKARLSL
ncbi:MAG: L-threonylcarbamoyladenylate synthase [bacterium]